MHAQKYLAQTQAMSLSHTHDNKIFIENLLKLVFLDTAPSEGETSQLVTLKLHDTYCKCKYNYKLYYTWASSRIIDRQKHNMQCTSGWPPNWTQGSMAHRFIKRVQSAHVTKKQGIYTEVLYIVVL